MKDHATTGRLKSLRPRLLLESKLRRRESLTAQADSACRAGRESMEHKMSTWLAIRFPTTAKTSPRSQLRGIERQLPVLPTPIGQDAKRRAKRAISRSGDAFRKRYWVGLQGGAAQVNGSRPGRREE